MVLDDEVDNFCETITAKGDENTNEIKRDKMIVNQWVEHYLEDVHVRGRPSLFPKKGWLGMQL